MVLDNQNLKENAAVVEGEVETMTSSTLLSPLVDYYNDEEELESVDEEDERLCRGRDSDEDTEDASETDIAKHNDEDYVEMKEQMYQDKLASLKRQLQQLQEGTLQEYQKRLKKLDQQYKERVRNAVYIELFLQLETEQVEKNYIKEKKAAVKEFEDKKVELKENLIAELEEKKKMIENEKLTMELTGDSMEVKPIMTRKLRRRPNDPVPIPDKRRKPAPAQLNYLLTEEQIMEDLRSLNKALPARKPEGPPKISVSVGLKVLDLKLKSPKRPVSPSSPEQLPITPTDCLSHRYEARIEDGKLYYDKRWYHKSQAIYLESKDNAKISCVISSVGTNEIWVRKTSDSTKMRIYLGQLQRGAFVIRRRSAA
ncbi:sin3 histone deacetylase corepressor complex component SDS3 isoform X1 [Protopterus annectens]|uniref:sin3 histone deacetylase corepressor complex component SDS3 isoform X1 n=1 Tax=Protopterus annectens TaxID=7888 RepID=UPI001CFC2AD3|nr:sin3 histone deacetylase corepressor complex component SDS3 isoform X1 [Protopterus annectens]